MCGICGIVHFSDEPVRSSSIQMMMNRMKYRGPDDEGIFIERSIGLGSVRLSIIDLSPTGHQPMISSDQRFVIVYNGEIYNYIEIRRELLSKGYIFKSETDTEVLLNSYIEWGKQCLEKLNGMFSFVIYDKKTQYIFGVRDRFGIKPFYYFRDNSRFVFASEIPSILTILEQKPFADQQSIFDFLVFNRTDHTEGTFFRDIKKLQHGHFIEVEQSNVRISKWYCLKEKISSPSCDPEGFNDLFKKAIGLRLRSDVPVGVCLSGGLDSSSIISVLLKEFGKRHVNTFSAVYGKGQVGDESEFINEFSKDLDSMYYVTPTAETLLKDISSFISAHAEPIPSTSPYAQFKVMELAKNYVGVTLDGQGADEGLAGYHYFFGYFYKDLLRNMKLLKLGSEIVHYFINHQSLFALKTFLFFLLPQGMKTRIRKAEKGYVNREFFEKYKSDNVVAGNLYSSNSLRDALLDHYEYKLEHLLKWEDRNSMWFSIESRVPFLDHNLVEQILAIDGSDIIENGMTKSVLRKSMKDILPEKIRTRKDKIGFMTPENEWFRSDGFSKLILDILYSKNFKNRGFVNSNATHYLYNRHLSRKINISKEIWKWIHLELWFREFID